MLRGETIKKFVMGARRDGLVIRYISVPEDLEDDFRQFCIDWRYNPNSDMNQYLFRSPLDLRTDDGILIYSLYTERSEMMTRTGFKASEVPETSVIGVLEFLEDLRGSIARLGVAVSDTERRYWNSIWSGLEPTEREPYLLYYTGRIETSDYQELGLDVMGLMKLLRSVLLLKENPDGGI